MKDLLLIGNQHPGNPFSARFNDLEVENYDFKVVEGPARKIQDVIKIIMTQKGLNVVYPSYGSQFAKKSVVRDADTFNTELADSVREAMAWVQRQEESNRPDERIKRIVSLSVSNGSSASEKQATLVLELEDGSTLTTVFPV